jgi:hypothetical protein
MSALATLCENSQIRIAYRNSVSISLISEINCTDSLCQRKTIENKFLLVLGFRTFSHSLGQKAKYSLRADVLRFGPNNGHRSIGSACLFGANSGSEQLFSAVDSDAKNGAPPPKRA